jgi:hypothetical protein
MIYRTFLITILLAVSGCATNQYYHPTITNQAEAERAKKIDLAECRQMASAGFTNPTMMPLPQSHPSYQVQGNVSGYNSSGEYENYTYRSTVTPTNTNSFSSGFASGHNIGAQMAVTKDRNDFTHACMLKRGWAESEQEAQAIRASMTKQPRKTKAADEWEMTVKQFLISQSSMRGDADYINHPDRMETLDAYVKALASDDKNKDKPMIWFLEEADKLVKIKYGITP